jgi:hypothetical protein
MTTSSKKTVTIASLALAAMITLTAGVVHSVPATDLVWNPPTKIAGNHIAPTFAKDQQPVLGREDESVGRIEASRIVPCLMPKAWQRGCEASAVKVASR